MKSFTCVRTSRAHGSLGGLCDSTHLQMRKLRYREHKDWPKVTELSSGKAGPSDPMWHSSASRFSYLLALPLAPQPGSQLWLVPHRKAPRLGGWRAPENSGLGLQSPPALRQSAAWESLGQQGAHVTASLPWGPAVLPLASFTFTLNSPPLLPPPSAWPPPGLCLWSLHPQALPTPPSAAASPLCPLCSCTPCPTTQPRAPHTGAAPSQAALSPGSWAPLCPRQHGLLTAPTCALEQMLSLCGIAQH